MGHYEQELLPDGWVICTIDQLVPTGGIFIDGDWVESKDQDPNGNVRLIQLADIGDSYFINKSSRFLTKTKARELNCTFLKNGDLLVARMPEPLGRACIFPLDGDEKFVTVVDVCAIRLGESSPITTFLMYLINSPAIRLQIEEYKSGSTRKRISRKNLARVCLPIAPINEQHRIVAKIEELFSELDKGIESLKTAREQLEVYRQALLKHAFEGKLTEQWRKDNADKLETANELLARIKTEREQRYQLKLNDWQRAVNEWEDDGREGKKPAKPKIPKELPPLSDNELSEFQNLPNGWVLARLGATNVDVFDGPFGSNLKTSDYVESGVRIIRLENIGVLEFIDEKKSFVTNEKYETIKKHTVSCGDIIFSSFVTENTRVVILPDGIEKAVNKADCFCVRTNGDLLNNRYIATFLATRKIYKQIEEKIHGVGRPRINTTQLKECCIPLCGIDEQLAIIQVVDERLSITDKFENSIYLELDRIEALRQSILKKAFSGQLVPQDTNDEPASVLLERIQAEKAAMAEKKKQTKQKRKGKPPHEC